MTRDVIVIGPTKDVASDFARRLEDDVRARALAARPSIVNGHQADHWIILHGVPANVAAIVERNAKKNRAPVTYR